MLKQVPYCLYLHIWCDTNWFTDYDGMRLCLRTAATNRPIVHSPGDTWTWRAMVMMLPAGGNSRLIHQSSLAVLPAETSGSKRSENFDYQYLRYLKGSLTSVKSYSMGPPALLPIQRKVCCGFLLPLKIHCLGRVWNLWPLGPVASTLTTTPPSQLWFDIHRL
jgi:hypothetical protein